MELGLAGTVVVVFGAARGIGAAIARAFAAEAAAVVAVDRDPGVLELAGQLPGTASHLGSPAAPSRGEPGERPALGLVADVTDFAAVRGAAEEVTRRFGRVDHVVFAVG